VQGPYRLLRRTGFAPGQDEEDRMNSRRSRAHSAGRRVPWRPRVPPAWTVLLIAVPVMAVFYLLLPVTGVSRTVAYPAFSLIGMGAILLGIRRQAPARPGSWRFVALALALLAAGDTVYSIMAFAGVEPPYPSVADIAYLGAYVALILGVAGLIKGRVPGSDRTALIDAAILSAGAASVFWIAVVHPSLVGSGDPLVWMVSMAYPGMDILLLALGLRVLLSSASRPRFLQVLMAGIGLYFVADVIYAANMYPDWLDAGWIVGVLLIGVAALHPSVADGIDVLRADEAGGLSRGRFALLGASALIAPAVLVLWEVQSGDDIVVGLIVAWTIVFGLVLVRLATTVDELGVTLTQRGRLQGDLAYQANHDPLTQLANRLLFETRLTAAVKAAPEATALIFLDLDDFKTINDTLGHATGDELLRILAGRVQRGLRRSDLAARLGGDEFAILVEGCDDPATARAVAERALTALRAPVTLGTRQHHMHASAGVAMGHAGSTAMDLMRDADVAMYQAKSHGKDQVEAFEAAMHTGVIRGYELRTELADAIQTNAFELHYQAAVNLDTGAIVGAEALVRWNHPERGLLGPQDFIPQAESSGLIHALGRWILREACETATRWPDRLDGQRPALSVNLSAAQVLEPGIVADVAAILAETGLPANKLILEVTESALIELEVARTALLGLRELGVLLALDDFGTGYSSLSYLASLPFDIVKIDQAFVAGIGQHARVDALFVGIVGLCDALDLVTVTEGIERKAQLDRVVELGCHLGQGYLFARPVPSAEFAATLTTKRNPEPGSAGLFALPPLGAARATPAAS
jgi:diguanylate cyclase (GGDEF)-like protein